MTQAIQRKLATIKDAPDFTGWHHAIPESVSLSRTVGERSADYMRMLLNVIMPHEPFNTAVREGTAGETIGKILEESNPEAVYFTEQDGQRGATLVVNVENPLEIPALAEPWFLNYNADCKFRIAMSPEDLQQAGLEELGKKWA